MIKKLLFTTTLLLFSFLALSQSNAEQQASEMTKEMVLALSLDDVQKEKIYKIQLQRFNQAKLIREQYRDEPQIKNAELKKVYNKLYGKLHAAIGKELMSEWKTYKKNK
tara:strand:- start:35806 stop:36132 length:327 start_codon:yes stop_codon:yes gene_type:complete